MALTTEIMTVAEVKTLAIVDSNLDTAYLDDNILPSQRKWFRSFLGNDFYEEILGQVDNSATLTTDNNTLIEDYIKPALAHYVIYRALPRIRNQVAKGGVYNPLSETADVASGLDYGRLRDDYLTKAEELRLEIDFFIKDAREDDATKYPLYCKNESQSGGIILY